MHCLIFKRVMIYVLLWRALIPYSNFAQARRQREAQARHVAEVERIAAERAEANQKLEEELATQKTIDMLEVRRGLIEEVVDISEDAWAGRRALCVVRARANGAFLDVEVHGSVAYRVLETFVRSYALLYYY